MTALLQAIPALWRDRIYGAYVLIGFLLGAVQVAIAGVPDLGEQPRWLTIALVVYAYIGTAFVGMAKANTTAASGPPPAPTDPPAPGQQGSSNVVTILAIVALMLLAVWLATLVF